MRRFWFTPLLVLLAVSACETREAARGDSSSGTQAVRPERKSEEVSSAPACATMRDVVPSDLVALDGDVLYQLDETEGLVIADVADPSSPRALARLPFVGAPLALHLRPPHAFIAWVDWDVPGAATRIQALDIRHPDAPRVIGTASRPGIVTGTALVDGVLYVMSAEGGRTSIGAHRIDGARFIRAGEILLDGRPGALAASPAGLAALTIAPPGISVSWIDLAYDRPGAMTVRGTRRVDGGFPAWERDIVDADEGQAVCFLACQTPACGPEEDAVVRVVDFARGADDVRASLPIRVAAGVPVARFANDRLFIGEGTTLRVVELHPTPRVIGSVKLAGTVSALRAIDTRVIAVGTVGTPATGIQVAVEDVDVRVPSLPRVRGMAKFGHDWTWTRAADDDRALSIDPTTELLAMPFSTWRARDGRYATGAQVISLGRRAPALRETLPADGHVERVLFVKGRVLAIGEGNVTVLEPKAERELEVR